MTDEKRQQTLDRIGQRILTLRKLQGMTQDELATRAGIQRTHLGRIESGKYNVAFTTIQAIAEALGMTVDMIDPSLANLAPLKTLTPTKGVLGEHLASKVTDTLIVKN